MIMGGDVQSNRSRCNRLTGRAKVKSGCRTCKIRKVKCDEGQPACHRCLSTGRVCDGYGIWGGGGNAYGNRQRSVVLKNSGSIITPWPLACVSILAAGTEEHRYFEWFKCRAAKKIPGPFVLTFWRTLLFQASLNEPAVLHALLTLSAVHKRDIFDGNGQSRNIDAPDEQEQFMLEHYIKAIRHLQPHFSTKDRASIRVALITCVLFVCLEFLRGRFRTAEAHLQNGLKVLDELRLTSNAKDRTALSTSALDSVDGWTVEVFSRLHVQMELFRLSYRHPCLFLKAPGAQFPLAAFDTIAQAWQHLERLLIKIFDLTEQNRQRTATDELQTACPPTLLEYQENIRRELAIWLKLFEASRESLQIEGTVDLPCRLLSVYHIMATIMVDTCLQPHDDPIYDFQIEPFLRILEQSIDMWQIGTSRSLNVPGHYLDMSRSMIDIGWIPPLYYVALYCRAHRVRLHAIRLIGAATHREGIWDSKIVAKVARMVMQIEEGDFYKDIDTGDDFSLSNSPTLQGLWLVPTLPRALRLQEVKVVLPNDPSEGAKLFYKRSQSGEEWEDIDV